MSNIILLEDDHTLSREIGNFLSKNNYICDCIYDGSLIQKQYRLKNYELAILDINVPGTNGFEVCKILREIDPKISILMLTAFGDVSDKVKAFNNGADDYLIKPFHFEELLVRVKSLLRRKAVPQLRTEEIKIADLIINNTEMNVFRGGNEIKLSPKEFKLLYMLAKANGRIIPKSQIADNLWDYHIETNQNTIEVYINFLRKKIDKGFEKKLIHTKIGYGYYLKEEE